MKIIQCLRIYLFCNKITYFLYVLLFLYVSLALHFSLGEIDLFKFWVNIAVLVTMFLLRKKLIGLKNFRNQNTFFVLVNLLDHHSETLRVDDLFCWLFKNMFLVQCFLYSRQMCDL